MSHKLRRQASPWLPWSHKLASFSVFMKTEWFHLLYSYKEKSCVYRTVCMADTVCFEQFYCFPLQSRFLVGAGGHLAPPVLIPPQTVQLQLLHDPPASPLHSATQRVASSPGQSTFTGGPGICQARAQPGGGGGGKETVPALGGRGRWEVECARARSQGGEGCSERKEMLPLSGRVGGGELC